MFTVAEIRLVAAVLLTLLVGWAVTAWREHHSVEIIPIEAPLQLKKTVKHYDHVQE